MITGRKAITTAELNAYASVLTQQDSIFYPLYDYQTYPAAGQQAFTFFTLPIGQGTTSAPGGTGPRTALDTNLTTAGMLPQGNQFVVKGIEFEFFPGGMPAFSAAAAIAANTSNAFVRDVYTVMRNGVVKFRVQDRDYVQDGPLMKFPTQTRLAGFGALTESANAAATNAQLGYAAACGAGYNMVPLRLYSNQAFQVTVTFPALITLPSTVDARIGCRLVGDMIRNAQ
jgi:hypothetical protein